MKKVLFVIPSFNIGGTTVSVRNLISVIGGKYKCEVLPLSDKGDLANLYSDVKQIKPNFISYALYVPSCRQERLLRFIIIAIIRLFARYFRVLKELLIKRIIQRLAIDNSYDIVVACQEGEVTRFTSLIKCKNKIAWVRCDYVRYLELIRADREEFYKNFNHIVCVSDYTKSQFLSIYPKYSNNTYSINNPQDANYILSQSQIIEDENRFKRDRYTIVSIGRFDIVKRFDQIPIIAKTLRALGNSFYFYIIGNGAEKDNILENIKKYSLQDYVILLGVKTNPYFYLRNADLFVTTSISEACPRVVNEAKILRTPVVSTDFQTIFEYIDNNKTGMISPIEKIHLAIHTMMNEVDVAETVINNISEFQFNNDYILSQIEYIFENI